MENYVGIGYVIWGYVDQAEPRVAIEMTAPITRRLDLVAPVSLRVDLLSPASLRVDLVAPI